MIEIIASKQPLTVILKIKSITMSKSLVYRLLFLGFLSWLIPFAISFLFYKPGGELMVPYATFKSAIMMVGVISGSYLLYKFYLHMDSDYIRNGLIAGMIWFLINIGLDTIVLIPIMKTTFSDYFMSIGLGYFAIPALSITFGFLLDRKCRTKIN